MTTDCLRVTVHQPLWLEWEYRNEQANGSRFAPIALPVPICSMPMVMAWRIISAVTLKITYYGLGEKAGDLQPHRQPL